MTSIRESNLIRRAEKAILATPLGERHLARALRRNVRSLRQKPGDRDARFKVKCGLLALGKRCWC